MSPFNVQQLDAICRTDLTSFGRKCFELLNPGTQFQMNYHIEALAYHLEQVRLGRITRLIINLPPRSLKSLMSSVAFPAFVLGHDPTKRIVGISYSNELAGKFCNDCRQVMISDWYQRLFLGTRISRIKNTESEVMTTRNGYRLATSIDATLTGRGGDILIIDDPLKSLDALSDSPRERVNAWFPNTLIGRLDNKRTSAIIVVMQRLHSDDLAGRLLRDSNDWTVLSLPAIAEQDQTIQLAADRYHLRRAGDVLDPEREPQSVLDRIRSMMGSDTFAAQYQQAPVPPGGMMIKREWIRRYDQLPTRDSSSQIIQSWDTASKAGSENDWSVCTTWLYQNKIYYLLDVLRGRFEYPTLRAQAISHAKRHEPNKILVEDSGVGTALIAELKDTGFSVIAVKAERDKKTRMAIETRKFEGGQVAFPTQALWLADLEPEVYAFPNSLHDDQVDSISQALAHGISAYGWDDRSVAGFSRFVEGLVMQRRLGFPY
jgi:predicted phage terminase large subunit-like protein